MNRRQITYVSNAIPYLLLYRDMALQHTFSSPQFILLRATCFKLHQALLCYFVCTHSYKAHAEQQQGEAEIYSCG